MTFSDFISHLSLHSTLIGVNAFICYYGAWVCSRVTWYPPSSNPKRNKRSQVYFRLIGALYFVLALLHSVRLFQLWAGMADLYVISSSLREIIATAFTTILALFMSSTFSGKLHDLYKADISKKLLRQDE